MHNSCTGYIAIIFQRDSKPISVILGKGGLEETVALKRQRYITKKKEKLVCNTLRVISSAGQISIIMCYL